MKAPNESEALVASAQDGDAAALEDLCRRIKDDVYGLAVRMLAFPPDAEDATQEILIKVVTHLGEFRGESAFRTWVFTIASRHLMKFRRGVRESFVSFELIEEMIADGEGRPYQEPETAEERLLAEEVKIGCTGAMLVALDRDHRIAYTLGEIFSLSSDEAASVLDIPPATFRKRLSRARGRLRQFMTSTCGLVDPENSCRCPRQLRTNVARGTIDPDRLLFATHPTCQSPRLAAQELLREVDEIETIASIFRSHPDYAAPERVVDFIRSIINDDDFRMFRN